MCLKTVLVVDDEPAILKLVTVVLRKAGYTVLEAADGKAALELAVRHQGPIHLLITDVCMPGLPGPSVCERMRQVRPGTRCLLMSGYQESLWECYSAGFLAKPFSIPDLIQCVRQTLAASDEAA